MMSWEDEYEFSKLKSAVVAHDRQLREMQKTLKELQELHDFVKYVDNTAPELRIAFQVSKRIE